MGASCLWRARYLRYVVNLEYEKRDRRVVAIGVDDREHEIDELSCGTS